MNEAGVVLVVGCGPFSQNGIQVSVIGSKNGKEVHFEESVLIMSHCMNRPHPLPSVSISLDDAIIFFENCMELCKKAKNDMGVE